jgi:hypothetical protein
MQLDQKSTETVLRSLREAIHDPLARQDRITAVNPPRPFQDVDFARFPHESGLDLDDVYDRKRELVRSSHRQPRPF